MMAEALNLSDEQLEKMKAIRTDTKRKMIDLKAELEKAELDMQVLWDKGVPSQNKVDKQIDQISALKAKMAKTKAATRISMLSMLTSEQLAEHDKLKAGKAGPGKCGKGGGPRGHGLRGPGHGCL